MPAKKHNLGSLNLRNNVADTLEAGLSEAPIDGTQYTRKDGEWDAVAAAAGGVTLIHEYDGTPNTNSYITDTLPKYKEYEFVISDVRMDNHDNALSLRFYIGTVFQSISTITSHWIRDTITTTEAFENSSSSSIPLLHRASNSLSSRSHALRFRLSKLANNHVQINGHGQYKSAAIANNIGIAQFHGRTNYDSGAQADWDSFQLVASTGNIGFLTFKIYGIGDPI